MSASGKIATRSHIPTLDGVRGIAILLVLVAHVPDRLLRALHPRLIDVGHILGYLGVDLFFVLSGFLITRILLVDAHENAPIRDFYLRRALRIFPIYYLVLVIYAVASPNPALPWCAVYLSNYYFALQPNETLLGHTWSLAVEEHFYLVWPFLIRRLPLATARHALVGLMLLSVASSAAFILSGAEHASQLIYSGSLSRMWSLCLGAGVAYRALGAPPPLSLAARGAPWIIGTICVGCGLLLAKAGLAWAYLMNVIGFSSISLGVVLVALHVNDEARSSARAILVTAPLRYSGKVSYGLYLYHPFVYAFVFGHADGFGLLSGTPWPLQLVAAISLAVALASASFYAFEQPFLRLKTRFVRPAVS